MLTPVGDGLRAELYGDLAAITAINKNPGSLGEPGLLSLGAGTRNQRYLQALRAKIPRA